jgi:hypothetical protein
MAKPELRGYIVNVEHADAGRMRTLCANRVDAAYFKSEGGFTTFKDSDNAAVYSVRNDCLVSIERVQDGAELLSALQALLREADEKGSASARLLAAREIDPNDTVYESHYDVKVSTVASVAKPER